MVDVTGTLKINVFKLMETHFITLQNYCITAKPSANFEKPCKYYIIAEFAELEYWKANWINNNFQKRIIMLEM